MAQENHWYTVFTQCVLPLSAVLAFVGLEHYDRRFNLYFTTVFVCALSELNHNAQHFVRHRTVRVVGNCESNLIVLITSDHSFKVITVGIT